MRSAPWLLIVLAQISTAATKMVTTPHGLRDASKVHLVPSGAEIHHVGDDEIHVFDSNGTLILATKTDCGNPSTNIKTRALETGWVAYASWSNETAIEPISYFNASWIVPSTPQKVDGQTLFLFNGLQPSKSSSTILQPVVQWGHSDAGGGHYWAAANWYSYGDIAFHTQLYRVGYQVVTGFMTRWEPADGYVYYRSSFLDLPGAGELTIRSHQNFYWAAIALAAEHLSSVKNFPPAWTTFAHINLFAGERGYPDVKWSTYASAVDGLRTVVNKQGSRDAEVTIVY
ncbi:hypothetical protein DL93DRAFT_2086504 [Clavulina sp. PMI_390]|nr:hypothetical protein DL93DRAFT_2086504 [Clavulina sp. PMI_390]